VRAKTDTYGHRLYGERAGEQDARIIARVTEIAAQRSVAPAQVALAWLLKKPGVVAPIVGASKAQHVRDAVAAIEVELSTEEIARLEEPYEPRAVAGIL
jgi:aryl-alcohol dehydrogenase (NADP+)